MPHFRTVLPLAALALAAPAALAAQQPYKRMMTVSRGMTTAQVASVLGPPARVVQRGSEMDLYYYNGNGEDRVVVRDCRLVDASFRNPSRRLSDTPAPVGQPAPPPEECQPPRTAQTPRPAPLSPPQRPTDVGPGGAMPADPPRLVPPAPAPPPPPPAPSQTVDAAPSSGAAMASEPMVPQQDPTAWRRQLSLRHPETRLIAVPAASVSTPTAFGVQGGEAFVGVAYQARTRYTHVDDGAAVLGFGLGNRDKLVGLEIAATSYSTLRGGGPLETGGLSFKLHRAFGPDYGVAVGMENAVDWGGSDAGHSAYGVVTRVFHRGEDPAAALSALAVSVGAGNGRFRSEDDVAADNNTVNFFGAIGLQIAEPVSLTADWTGQDLYAAVSVAPIRHVPLVLNAGLADITGSAGDGARFIFSAGYGFLLRAPFLHR